MLGPELTSGQAEASTAAADDLSPRGATLAALALVFAMFLGQLVLLGSPARFHGDEKYYTDAVLHMKEAGDYLTPHYEDGTQRLRKPILTYWTILAGSWTFGPGYAAARIFILAGACGVLLLTFRLTRTLFGRRDAALAATALLLADHEFFTASWRLNPDALLTLFTTLAFLGFALHRFSDSRRPGALLTGYLGAGLAVATKGFLGLAVPVYALGFLALVRGDRSRGSDPAPRTGMGIHLLGILLLAAVGGGWYLLVLERHGAGALGDFFRDQTGRGSGGSGPWTPAVPLGYLASTLGNFLAAVVVLGMGLLADGGAIRSAFRRYRRPILFALGWAVLVLLVFSCGRLFRPRYLLPAHPLLAAASAVLIVEALRGERTRARLARTAGWATGGALLLAAGVALLGYRLDSRFPLAAGVIAVGTLLLRGASRKQSARTAFGIACLGVFLLLWTYDAILRPIYGGTAVEALLESARTLPPQARVLAVGVPDRLLAQSAFLSGGRFRPESRSRLPEAGSEPDAVLFLPERIALGLPSARYRILPGGTLWGRIDGALFLDALRGRERQSLLAERRRRYVLAVPVSQ